MKILIEYELTPAIVQALLCDCFEGGYSPWIHGVERVSGKYDHKQNLVWYGQDGFTHGEDGNVAPFKFKLVYDREEDAEGEGKGSMVISPRQIGYGLQALQKANADIFARIMALEGDALDADAFMQCVVFGKVIYG